MISVQRRLPCRFAAATATATAAATAAAPAAAATDGRELPQLHQRQRARQRQAAMTEQPFEAGYHCLRRLKVTPICSDQQQPRDDAHRAQVPHCSGSGSSSSREGYDPPGIAFARAGMQQLRGHQGRRQSSGRRRLISSSGSCTTTPATHHHLHTAGPPPTPPPAHPWAPRPALKRPAACRQRAAGTGRRPPARSA